MAAATSKPGWCWCERRQESQECAAGLVVRWCRRLDRDWLDVGLTGIPGHPTLVGRATTFTYLDDARAALASIVDKVFTVRADG